MGYKLLKQLIALGRKTKEELLDMAEVYYKGGKLTGEEYGKIVQEIQEGRLNPSLKWQHHAA